VVLPVALVVPPLVAPPAHQLVTCVTAAWQSLHDVQAKEVPSPAR
jgi:hypothetical protein